MLFEAILMTLSEDSRHFAANLYEKHKKKIYAIAYSILTNRQDAEDVVNEVMIRVIQSIEKFIHADENEILAQLIIYSRNAAINLYRAKCRRALHETSYTYINEADEYEDVESTDESCRLEDIVLSQANAEIIAKYLKRLTQEQQDVIVLLYALGYSNTEVAVVLGITPNAVGMRLYKAKKKLLELGGDELRACL